MLRFQVLTLLIGGHEGHHPPCKNPNPKAVFGGRAQTGRSVRLTQPIFLFLSHLIFAYDILHYFCCFVYSSSVTPSLPFITNSSIAIRYASGQTYKQTKKQAYRHAHHNTSHLWRGKEAK